MLISILVFSFQSAAELSTSYETTIVEAQTKKFNNNFLRYTEGDVEIENVISMAYFAKDYNTKNDAEDIKNPLHISIMMGKTDLTTLSENYLIEKYLKDDDYVFVKVNENVYDKTKRKKYNCIVEYNSEGRIQKVTCNNKSKE